MSKERRLGRGLEALLGRAAAAKNNDDTPTQQSAAISSQSASHAESSVSRPTIDVRESSDTAANDFPRGCRAPVGRPGITPDAEISNGNANRALMSETESAVESIGPMVEAGVESSIGGRKRETDNAGGIEQPEMTATVEITQNTPTPAETSQQTPCDDREELSDESNADESASENESASEKVTESQSNESTDVNEGSDADVLQVNVALIEVNPFQPRKDFDDESMAELSESILAHGLLQPIVARRVDDVYQLIAGERRLRAAQKAGWDEVPVRVIETDERGAAELAIVENLQRKDLNPLEKAASFRRYIKEHRCTQEQLAHRLRIDRSTIANMMRLLELPEEVQKAITSGRISQGHARALLPLGEEREQVAFCRRIEREGLSVRKTEAMVQAMIQAADAEPLSLVGRDGRRSKSSNTADHLASLEQEFRAGLGTKVKITQGARGRGKLVIHFKNHDEFNRIKAHILGADEQQAKAG